MWPVMKYILLLVVFSTLKGALHRLGAEAQKPNVLFIVIDDLRPKLGCYGEDIISPNIDQLATQSMRFTNAHVQQAVCAPSRVSFLTGRRPDTTRLYDFGSYWREASGNYTTIPQYFKEAGYFSAGVGKVFHQGTPSNHTFDYPYSWSIPNYWPSTEQYQGQKVCNTSQGLKHNLLCPVDLNTQPEGSLPDIQNADYAVDLLANISEGAPYVDYWGNTQTMKEPFFIGLGFRKPHVPYKFPEKFKTLYPLENIKLADNTDLPPGLPTVAYSPYLATLNDYDDINALNLSFPYGPMPKEYHYLIRQHYYSSISFMDYQLGRVLSALDDHGFADNTIISFVGDHGYQLGEHSEFCKFTNYPIATNVPLMVHMPGMTDRGLTLPHTPKFPLIDPLQMRRNPSSDHLQIKRPGLITGGMEDTGIYHYHQRENGPSHTPGFTHQGPTTDAFAELVDLFPTVTDLAGLPVPAICPADSLGTFVCREGVSLAPLVHPSGGLGNTTGVKSCIISQYPRPSVEPVHSSILPKLSTIRIMGYSMRTDEYRYSEWVGFDHVTFQMDWGNVFGRELYILGKDPEENDNLAYNPAYLDIAERMSDQLHKGWRACIL